MWAIYANIDEHIYEIKIPCAINGHHLKVDINHAAFSEDDDAL